MSFEHDSLQPFEDIEVLLEKLKNEWPRSIFIYQWIMKRIKWSQKEPGKNLYWILCPGGELNDGLIIYGRTGEKIVYFTIFIFNDNIKTLERALLDTKRIPWSEKPVCGVPQNLSNWFIEIKEKLGFRLTHNVPTKYLWLRKETAMQFEIEMPSDVSVRKLTSDLSPKINSLWPHKFPGSECYINNLIRLNYGFGVHSKFDDELLSWAVIYEHGDIAVLQTKDQHQKKGYAKIITKMCSREKALEDEDPFAFIVDPNEASERLFRNLGFEYIGTYNWIEFEN